MALWLIRAGSEGASPAPARWASAHHLDPEVRADLPLKRIWTVASTDEDS